MEKSIGEKALQGALIPIIRQIAKKLGPTDLAEIMECIDSKADKADLENKASQEVVDAMIDAINEKANDAVVNSLIDRIIEFENSYALKSEVGKVYTLIMQPDGAIDGDVVVGSEGRYDVNPEIMVGDKVSVQLHFDDCIYTGIVHVARCLLKASSGLLLSFPMLADGVVLCTKGKIDSLISARVRLDIKNGRPILSVKESDYVTKDDLEIRSKLCANKYSIEKSGEDIVENSLTECVDGRWQFKCKRGDIVSVAGFEVHDPTDLEGDDSITVILNFDGVCVSDGEDDAEFDDLTINGFHYSTPIRLCVSVNRTTGDISLTSEWMLGDFRRDINMALDFYSSIASQYYNQAQIDDKFDAFTAISDDMYAQRTAVYTKAEVDAKVAESGGTKLWGLKGGGSYKWPADYDVENSVSFNNVNVGDLLRVEPNALYDIHYKGTLRIDAVVDGVNGFNGQALLCSGIVIDTSQETKSYIPFMGYFGEDDACDLLIEPY